MMQEFMRRAIALAMENVRSGAGGPFAAVIVKDGRVVAEGANRVTATNDPTAHAEVVAIASVQLFGLLKDGFRKGTDGRILRQTDARS